ncbi:GNAT family N-acetyltransferase [uncultured Roseobacter sp.]|uniref:GNAT family N-acetyltransferase n=1 Tax=uncultured Roseobacter sp. TaxID=114847 RepID=UPI003441EB82
MMTEFPTLETERLILRGPKPSDAEAFMAFYRTDRSQYTGGPMTDRQAWNFFGTEIGHWTIRGFGMFVVTRKGSDDPLGIVGHWYPHGWPEKEVGWVLFDAATEGQGIAREAAEACIAHAWNVLKWDTIVSYIHPDNAASIALAERLGATIDREALQPKPETPGLVYRHPRASA